MSKKLLLQIGAGTCAMKTEGIRGKDCLKVHEKAQQMFGYNPEDVTMTPTEEMNLAPLTTPQQEQHAQG